MENLLSSFSEFVPSFASFGLSEPTLAALHRAGFARPTPIQALAIPPAMSGKDVIGCAATGTGKTAAFVLPIVERLAGKHGTRALVLAPTRELALQIGEELNRFGSAHKVRGAVVIGGVGMGGQSEAFRANHEVIIATPGRLVDHLTQRTGRLDRIEVLVLDEADRMLDMGFKPQLTRILSYLPKERQTLLFSATMAGEVSDFARSHLRHPVRVEAARSGTTAAKADQRVFLVPQGEKTALIVALLAENDLSTLVFTRTKRRADKLTKAIARNGFKVARIHADRSQAQRRMALDGFKDGQYRVLVATDIAARGIDVVEIGHVVNFDLPHVAEDYVHRIGRTARAQASGLASTFAAPDEQDLLHAVERLTRVKLPRAEIPRESPEFIAEAKREKENAATGGGGHRRHAGGGGGGGGRPHGKPSAHRSSHGNKRPAHHHAKADAGGAAEARPGEKPRRIGSWKPKRRR